MLMFDLLQVTIRAGRFQHSVLAHASSRHEMFELVIIAYQQNVLCDNIH